MHRFLLCAALLAVAVPAGANGVIRGTIWSTRGEAKRADLCEEIEAENAPKSHGLFDFLGAASLRRKASTVPVVPARAGPRPPRRVKQPGVQDAVISVERIPDVVEHRLALQSQRDRSRPNARMTIHHSRYWPRVMAVAAGSDLEFQNLDRIWHSTFSVSSAMRFDLGKLRPGAIATVALPKPGVINLHCDIHPDESGFVMIAPNHAYARPDSLGQFALPRLPAGAYQIEIWHPLRGARTRQVVVPKRGDVQCNLAF